MTDWLRDALEAPGEQWTVVLWYYGTYPPTPDPYAGELTDDDLRARCRARMPAGPESGICGDLK